MLSDEELKALDGHTPGPWLVENSSDKEIEELCAEDGGPWIKEEERAADIHGHADEWIGVVNAEPTPAAGTANKRLIAAAPTLLADLRAERERSARLCGLVRELAVLVHFSSGDANFHRELQALLGRVHEALADLRQRDEAGNG